MESGKRFFIGNRDVFCPAVFFIETVFRSYARVIQAGCNGMRYLNLSVFVLEQITVGSVEDAGTSDAKGDRVFSARDAHSGCFHADKIDRVPEERIKETNAITTAAYAGNQSVRQTVFSS